MRNTTKRITAIGLGGREYFPCPPSSEDLGWHVGWQIFNIVNVDVDNDDEDDDDDDDDDVVVDDDDDDDDDVDDDDDDDDDDEGQEEDCYDNDNDFIHI
ncbi:hypothetical protein ElyMa_003075100 [Elysia marginata]|uniref:Uncharacterized protein n=1 Tax=Elysia marginata TaxID=1093978 RepID=A0AAV4IR65_9GAST|nr:hypothetical protein ElyMa_003075100 [Elysia marginata]